MEFLAAKPFMGALPRAELKPTDIVIVGAGFDGTTSFRPGARFGPEAIRSVSEGLELYCPDLDINLEEKSYGDLGDIDLPFGDTSQVMTQIYQTIHPLIARGAKVLLLGGEHSISYPSVKAVQQHHPELFVLQLDAHCDLRFDYMGVKDSHACVMRRIVELIGDDHVRQIGLRSGTQDEFRWVRQQGSHIKNGQQLQTFLDLLAGRPLYVTVDLDVLDPSIFPGTGTPEPGGMSFAAVIETIHQLAGANIVAADVVELSPAYDISGVSSIVAAKIVREFLAIL